MTATADQGLASAPPSLSTGLSPMTVDISGQAGRPESRRLYHSLHVHHRRRRGEVRPDEAAPVLELLRAAEVDGVVLQGLPAHDQQVARRLLDHTLQREPVAAPGAQEKRRGLAHAGFEVGLLAGLDV